MLYIMFDIIDVVQIQIYDNKSAYMSTVNCPTLAKGSK